MKIVLRFAHNNSILITIGCGGLNTHTSMTFFIIIMKQCRLIPGADPTGDEGGSASGGLIREKIFSGESAGE